MNAAERKFLYLALFLFALGGVSRLGAFNKLMPLQMTELPIVYEVPADSAAGVTLPDSTEKEEVKESVENKEKKEKKSKAKKKAPAFPININTASVEDLCFIKGVGPSLAKKIVEHREKKGNFRSAKDLEKVSGIGAKKRKSIEEFVVFL